MVKNKQKSATKRSVRKTPRTTPVAENGDDESPTGKGRYGESFSESFQSHLLTVAVRLPDAVIRFRPVFDHQYFNSGTNRAIARCLLTYVDKYHHVPTIPTLKQLVRTAYDKATADTAVTALKKMETKDISDAEGVLDMVVEFGKTQALTNAVLEAAEAIGEGDNDKVRPLIDNAYLVGTDLSDLGVDYSDKELRARRYLDAESMIELIPTGLPHLDYAMKGGLGRGELGVIFAPPKRGKSTSLINVAYGAMSQYHQYNVVYISCEMDQNRVATRFDDRLCTPSIRKLKSRDKEQYVTLLNQRAKDQLTGNLSIKQYPTRGLTPSKLRSYLTILSAQGRKPDLVVVDYADIMRAERRLGDMRHEQAGIYEDLRQIAGEFNCAIWTGSQTNRSSLLKDTLDLSDLAESFEKAAIADALIAFCQTDDERRNQHCRFALVALRNSQDGGVVDCNINRALCRVTTVGLYSVSGRPRVTGVDGDLQDSIDKNMLPPRAMRIQEQMDPDGEHEDSLNRKRAKRKKKKVSKLVADVM